MIGYGTHSQPKGTWSDDSSLTFCLMDSLINGYNIQDISNKFVLWLYDSLWTSHGNVFDIGISTQLAINKINQGFSSLDSGGKKESDNGNGSLMRISPLALFLHGKDCNKETLVKEVSSITHAHPRSIIACYFYTIYLMNLLNNESKLDAYKKAVKKTKSDLNNEYYTIEFKYFKRVFSGDIMNINKNDISSTGYVVHTLEASLWCFLNFRSYEEVVLNAVNLGDDTDTIGAIAGSMAGAFWGEQSIPENWVNSLARKKDISKLLEIFLKSLK